MKKSKNKKNEKYQLPSQDGINLLGLFNNISIKPKEQKNTPPNFTLEIGVPANNIAWQLKKQKIEFDPSVIKLYDKLIKGIVDLRTEKFISKKKSQKLILAVYERSIKHIYFIYKISDN
jgi:hypothetical protein